MHPFPHHYTIDASVAPTGDAPLSAEGVGVIESAPPVEFGGPGNRWSPEALLTAALVDCLILNFRGIAQMSRFEWISLKARTVGTVDRADGKMRFTHFDTRAELVLPEGADAERARQLLHKAESTCPISNSLSCVGQLTIDIRFSPKGS
ncbi:MAG TPA: OsmC family protein [Steroidobacteraceae bacterium]|jgi:organic hydroperoxide reductase OsmC/OhrA